MKGDIKMLVITQDVNSNTYSYYTIEGVKKDDWLKNAGRPLPDGIVCVIDEDHKLFNDLINMDSFEPVIRGEELVDLIDLGSGQVSQTEIAAPYSAAKNLQNIAPLAVAVTSFAKGSIKVEHPSTSFSVNLGFKPTFVIVMLNGKSRGCFGLMVGNGTALNGIYLPTLILDTDATNDTRFPYISSTGFYVNRLAPGHNYSYIAMKL